MLAGAPSSHVILPVLPQAHDHRQWQACPAASVLPFFPPTHHSLPASPCSHLEGEEGVVFDDAPVDEILGHSHICALALRVWGSARVE